MRQYRSWGEFWLQMENEGMERAIRTLEHLLANRDIDTICRNGGDSSNNLDINRDFERKLDEAKPRW